MNPHVLSELEIFARLVLLFYAIVTVFQLYHGGDMMHEMRRRKSKPMPSPTQEIFNLPHHLGMV